MDIEFEIDQIKSRNVRVEAEKAWETSIFRKLCILLLTYFLVMILMAVIGIEKPYVAALVPSLGFFLSTLGLGFLKNFWICKVYKGRDL